MHVTLLMLQYFATVQCYLFDDRVVLLKQNSSKIQKLSSGGVPYKKVSLNLQGNTCAGVFLKW